MEYNICLASKAVRYKPYSDLQSLPVPTHCSKDLLIDFVNVLPVSTDWRRNSYDLNFVIINQLMKMVYYKPVKFTINTLGLAKGIIDVVVKHYSLINLIVINCGSLFISKFWSLLSYFPAIKRRLSTPFYP